MFVGFGVIVHRDVYNISLYRINVNEKKAHPACKYGMSLNSECQSDSAKLYIKFYDIDRKNN